MAQPVELITVGHILKEVIKFPDKTIGPVLGSPAAYACVAASRLGMQSGIITRIGSDMPAQLLQSLIDAGVDICGISSQGNKTRTSQLTYDLRGNKKIIYTAVAPKIEVSNIPEDYFKAKAALLCPLDSEVSIEVAEALFNKNVILMTDLGGHGGTVSTWHPSPGDHDSYQAIKELVRFCEIVKVSDEDCKYIFGESVPLESVSEQILDWGTKIVLITMGAKGSMLITRDGRTGISVFPGDVVDTTGAGDVYCGGFLVAYIRSNDPEKAAIFASATASIMIEKSGGVLFSRMPTTQEVLSRIQDE